MAKSIAILIDGANFYETAKKLHFAIDYKRLLDYFQDYDIQSANFFTGLKPEHDGLHAMVHWMSCNGYRTYTKIGSTFVNSEGDVRYKANMDVEISVQGMLLANRVDEVHLFTGDGDFTALVQAMQHDGAKVVLYSSIAPDVDMCSDKLRRQADMFVDLDKIKHKLCKTTAAPNLPPTKRKFFG